MQKREQIVTKINKLESALSNLNTKFEELCERRNAVRLETERTMLSIARDADVPLLAGIKLEHVTYDVFNLIFILTHHNRPVEYYVSVSVDLEQIYQHGLTGTGNHNNGTFDALRQECEYHRNIADILGWLTDVKNRPILENLCGLAKEYKVAVEQMLFHKVEDDIIRVKQELEDRQTSLKRYDAPAGEAVEIKCGSYIKEWTRVYVMKSGRVYLKFCHFMANGDPSGIVNDLRWVDIEVRPVTEENKDDKGT